MSILIHLAHAQSILDQGLVVCGKNGPTDCDFNALIRQIQTLITWMIVVAVPIATGFFAYAGLLYISGKKPNIDKATNMFKKVGSGFLIMLLAWFIIYQILAWLTDPASGFATLLGTP